MMNSSTIRVLVLTVVAALAGCADRPDSGAEVVQAAQCCEVTLQATVPEGTGTVYLAGSVDSLGPWRPDGQAMTGEGRERSARIVVPPQTDLEYKFTLGSWDRQATGPTGIPMPNFALRVDDHQVVRHDIGGFKADPVTYMNDWQGSGVQGTLVYWQDVASSFLEESRHVGIWLPPGYDADERYPVLYMHDGQNLFDPRLTGNGEIWDVDDAVVGLVDSGEIPPVIVVGAFNSADRFFEYSPWHGASDYARFLIEELMPRVNEEFSTLTGPGNTAVMGSSMGGLLSYYLVTHHPDVFGACGCISSHFVLSEAWRPASPANDRSDQTLDETPFIIRDIENGHTVPDGVRYWFDYGTEGTDAPYHGPHEAVRAWLLEQGLQDGEDFVMAVYEGAGHNEASWRARLDDPLRFLFSPGN